MADPPVRIDFRSRAWFNENLESRNYFVPGVIVIVVSLVSLLLTSMAVVREKEIGTIEQIMVTPITPAEFILGKTLPFALIAFVDVTLILLIGVFWFEVPIRGSILLLYCLDGPLPADHAGRRAVHLHGQPDAAAGDDEHVLLLLSGDAALGLFLPDRQHAAGHPVADLSQPAWPIFSSSCGRIFLKGVGLAYLWPHLLALAAMGVATLALAVRRFHKTL